MGNDIVAGKSELKRIFLRLRTILTRAVDNVLLNGENAIITPVGHGVPAVWSEGIHPGFPAISCASGIRGGNSDHLTRLCA
jgi:hypothetical protein